MKLEFGIKCNIEWSETEIIGVNEEITLGNHEVHSSQNGGQKW